MGWNPLMWSPLEVRWMLAALLMLAAITGVLAWRAGRRSGHRAAMAQVHRVTRYRSHRAPRRARGHAAVAETQVIPVVPPWSGRTLGEYPLVRR